MKELLENGTWACGTIRQNRKDFPPALCVSEESHLKPGEFQFATSGQITLVHWYDRRDVYVMSTMHGTTAERIEKHPKGSKEKRQYPVPQASLTITSLWVAWTWRIKCLRTTHLPNVGY